jgi:hypothetical protein
MKKLIVESKKMAGAKLPIFLNGVSKIAAKHGEKDSRRFILPSDQAIILLNLMQKEALAKIRIPIGLSRA